MFSQVCVIHSVHRGTGGCPCMQLGRGVCILACNWEGGVHTPWTPSWTHTSGYTPWTYTPSGHTHPLDTHTHPGHTHTLDTHTLDTHTLWTHTPHGHIHTPRHTPLLDTHTPWTHTPFPPPPIETIEAGGMHSTGMHSCFDFMF